jgi:hypothetical protein
MQGGEVVVEGRGEPIRFLENLGSRP